MYAAVNRAARRDRSGIGQQPVERGAQRVGCAYVEDALHDVAGERYGTAVVDAEVLAHDARHSEAVAAFADAVVAGDFQQVLGRTEVHVDGAVAAEFQQVVAGVVEFDGGLQARIGAYAQTGDEVAAGVLFLHCLAALLQELGEHVVVRIVVHRFVAGEGQQVAAACRDGAGERNVQVAGAGRSKVGVEQKRLRRPGYVHLTVGEEFAAHALAARDVQHFQPAQPHSHSHHYLAQVAQPDAAEHCAAAAHAVGDGDVIEVQTVVVDMERAVDAVGYACGCYADAGVVDGGAAAGEGEAVERARCGEGAAHASGDVAQEAADERFRYDQVDAVEVGPQFHGPRLGMVGAGGAQHFAAVQVVAQHYVELVVGVVPIGARPERTGIHASYLQGVAVERSYGLDAVGEGRGEQGPAAGAAVDVVVVFEEVVYHGHVHVVQFQPQGVGL